MNVNDDVINTCHKVIHEVTLALANAIQTIENRKVIPKPMDYEQIPNKYLGKSYIFAYFLTHTL